MDTALYIDPKLFEGVALTHLYPRIQNASELLRAQLRLAMDHRHEHWHLFPCLLVLLFLASTRILFRARNARISALTLADFSPCMRALTAVIVPTRVAWPAHYSRAVKFAVSSCSKAITLDLHHLIADITSGKIELRHPDDLVELLNPSGLRIDGWLIALRVDAGWARGEQRAMVMEPIKVRLERIFWEKGPAEDKEYPRPGRIERPTLLLDPVAADQAEARLATFLPIHYACTVEFTTVSGGISPWTTPWILCALPFCTHRHTSGCMRPPSPTTPLFATLPATLAMITHINTKDAGHKPDRSGRTILAVRNTSADHAAYLLAHRERLHSDAATRTAYVARYGIECWRERRLMLAWEAALLRAGKLARWSVELRG
ncbi:hypothetical protein HDZ31DRAFT_83001 [Schizophyllum fasciatum]